MNFDSQQAARLLEFTSANVGGEITPVDCSSHEFHTSRKIYEQQRVDLQKKWKQEGIRGTKVTSKPSIPDYSILFSVQKNDLKIVTNDEILLYVAEAMLNEGCTYITEDLINAVLVADDSARPGIERAINNMAFLGESIKTARIYRPR